MYECHLPSAGLPLFISCACVLACLGHCIRVRQSARPFRVGKHVCESNNRHVRATTDKSCARVMLCSVGGRMHTSCARVCFAQLAVKRLLAQLAVLRRFEVAADNSSHVSGNVNSALPVCWRRITPTIGIVHQFNTSVTLPLEFRMPRPCDE